MVDVIRLIRDVPRSVARSRRPPRRDRRGAITVLPVRVYFEDTDFSGLVYHATYLALVRARPLRLPAPDGQRPSRADRRRRGREPAAFVVRRMQLEYLKPARIDEILEVRTQANSRLPPPLFWTSGSAAATSNSLPPRSWLC